MQNKPSGPLAWYGTELDEEAFVAKMAEKGRLIYEFEPRKVYELR